MTLAIDIGNTRLKLGFFSEGELVEKISFEEWDLTLLKEEAYNHRVKNVILSSVTHLEVEILDFLKDNFYFLQLTTSTPLPIENAYETPHTLGKDRIAAVVGAKKLFPNENCLVIDAGTCITYDLLNAEGTFLGGNISPGINLRLKAMHEFTAKLPLIERGEQEKIWGVSTETAMRNGGQYGAALEMQAFIDLSIVKFGQVNVLLTGGDANFFAKQLKTKIFVNPNLVLIGLNEILHHNVELFE